MLSWRSLTRSTRRPSIIAAHQQVQPDLKLYREALLKAPAVFRRIAETMEKRAGEHKTKFIKGGDRISPPKQSTLPRRRPTPRVSAAWKPIRGQDQSRGDHGDLSRTFANC